MVGAKLLRIWDFTLAFVVRLRVSALMLGHSRRGMWYHVVRGLAQVKLHRESARNRRHSRTNLDLLNDLTLAQAQDPFIHMGSSLN